MYYLYYTETETNLQCSDKQLSDVSSRSVMEYNGWEFASFVSKPREHYYCGTETVYGYNAGSRTASVSATFEGSGTATLTFGNCYSVRSFTVDVYFNNAKIATANASELRETVTFNFFKGSNLRIEVNGGIIKLNSLEISCDADKA